MGGWVSQHDFAVFARLVEWQDQQRIAGGFCEIGVFEGKRFLFFLLSLRSGERAVAVDVFDDVKPRRDFEPVFRANVVRHAGSEDAVAILHRDSSTVRAEDILQAAGASLRVFSVDGCHSAVAVEHDIALACATLAPDGLLIVDDYFNENWPGVSEGTLRFFMSPAGQARGIVPFAVFSTKVFFAQRVAAAQYLQHLRDWNSPYSLSEADLLGQTVVTLHAPPATTLAMRLAQSRAWQLGRRTPLGPLVRKLWGISRG